MLSLALNPEKAREMRGECLHEEADICSMCGEFCSAKINKEVCDRYQIVSQKEHGGTR
jgi:thiamine biosynthesis protein ThiC